MFFRFFRLKHRCSHMYVVNIVGIVGCCSFLFGFCRPHKVASIKGAMLFPEPRFELCLHWRLLHVRLACALFRVCGWVSWPRVNKDLQRLWCVKWFQWSSHTCYISHTAVGTCASRVFCYQVLEVLKEAHEWLCKENELAIRNTLEERGWMAAYNLQPDVPYPQRPSK